MSVCVGVSYFVLCFCECSVWVGVVDNQCGHHQHHHSPTFILVSRMPHVNDCAAAASSSVSSSGSIPVTSYPPFSLLLLFLYPILLVVLYTITTITTSTTTTITSRTKATIATPTRRRTRYTVATRPTSFQRYDPIVSSAFVGAVVARLRRQLPVVVLFLSIHLLVPLTTVVVVVATFRGRTF